MTLTSILSRLAVYVGYGARALEAVAAGTLSKADLRAGIAREWADYHQDAEDVFRGLMAWERAALDGVLLPGDRILVVGSGTGREMIALAQRGHEVVGVEPSAPAIAAARRFLASRGLTATLVHGFYEDADVPGAFDVVIFGYWCYTLMPGSANRIGALRKARASLRPGGRVAVSYVLGRGMHPLLIRLMRLTAVATRSEIRPEPGDEYPRISLSAPYFSYRHRFSAGAFEAEAHAAGLQIRRIDSGGGTAVLEDEGAPRPALVPAPSSARLMARTTEDPQRDDRVRQSGDRRFSQQKLDGILRSSSGAD